MRQLLQPRGFVLLKVIAAAALTAGLVMVDLQRQKKTSVAIKRRRSIQAVEDFKKSIQHHMGYSESISYSFGEEAATVLGRITARNRVQIYQTTAFLPGNRIEENQRATIANREAVGALNDEYAITGIVQYESNTSVPSTLVLRNDEYAITGIVNYESNTSVSSTLVLQQADVDGVRLIGIPNGSGGITSLDNPGWAYIRAMWVENFVRYDIRNDDVGNAELKILVWTFGNRLDSPSLDCLAANNCTKEVITLPIDITVDPNTALIVDGSYGLVCGDVLYPGRRERTLTIQELLSVACWDQYASEEPGTYIDDATFSPCISNQFFKKLEVEDFNPGPGADIRYTGRCCRPADEL